MAKVAAEPSEGASVSRYARMKIRASRNARTEISMSRPVKNREK